MTGGPQPPRRRHRRYPLRAYIPFLLMVVIPIVLLLAVIGLVVHALTPAGDGHPAGRLTPTAGPVITRPLFTFTPVGTPHTRPGAAHATLTPPATARSTARSTTAAASATATAAAVGATAAVTVAPDITSSGAPLHPAVIYRGRYARLYAFGTVPDVHAGDTVRFVWRDMTSGRILADFSVKVPSDQAIFRASMNAYPGHAPSAANPFPIGAYEVDLYHNHKLVAKERISVRSLQSG